MSPSKFSAVLELSLSLRYDNEASCWPLTEAMGHHALHPGRAGRAAGSLQKANNHLGKRDKNQYEYKKWEQCHHLACVSSIVNRATPSSRHISLVVVNESRNADIITVFIATITIIITVVIINVLVTHINNWLHHWFFTIAILPSLTSLSSTPSPSPSSLRLDG